MSLDARSTSTSTAPAAGSTTSTSTGPVSRWARDVTGWAVNGSHFLVEDQPEQVVDALCTLKAHANRALASSSM